MNPVVIVFLIARVFTIAIAAPLVARRVKRNLWYGIRIPAAFESEERWFEINQYGGRLLLGWGLAIVAIGLVGAWVPGSLWVSYDWAALVLIMGTLIGTIGLICRYARKFER